VFAGFLKIGRDEGWNTTLSFLDGFQPEGYGQMQDGEAARANSRAQPGP
jgi:hypothetical protein